MLKATKAAATFAALAMIACAPGVVRADSFGVSTGQNLAPPEPPPASATPNRLLLSYDGRILVKIIELEVEQRTGSKAYAANAHLTTHGVLALFRKINLKAVATGVIVAGKAVPHAFFHDNTDGKRERKVETVWAADEVKIASEPTFTTIGDPPASQAQRREATDPLTGLVRLAMSSSTDTPCGITERFFDGKQRYDVDFIPAGPGALDPRKQKLGLVEPMRCRLHYRPVAGFKKKSEEAKKEGLKKDIMVDVARVGPDGPWVISSMGADTFLGTARLELVKLDYNGHTATVASN
jgi:hypothetical protein